MLIPKNFLPNLTLPAENLNVSLAPEPFDSVDQYFNHSTTRFGVGLLCGLPFVGACLGQWAYRDWVSDTSVVLQHSSNFLGTLGLLPLTQNIMSAFVLMIADSMSTGSNRKAPVKLHFLTRPAAMLAWAQLNYLFELADGRHDALDFLGGALAISIYGAVDLFVEDHVRRSTKA